jgi:hypothetical protein
MQGRKYHIWCQDEQRLGTVIVQFNNPCSVAACLQGSLDLGRGIARHFRLGGRASGKNGDK